MNENDRRVKRTHRLLGVALLQLMQEKPYDTVTVRDITDRADIAYATFFRHFKSKDDLLLFQLDGMMRELEVLTLQSRGPYYRREGMLIFEHIQNNTSLYRSMFESSTFIKRFRERLAATFLVEAKHHLPKNAVPTMPLEVVAYHIAASLLALMEWWLSNRQPYSTEQMGEIYEKLIIQAAWSVTLDRP